MFFNYPVIVLTTIDSKHCKKFSQSLIQSSLAACVNIFSGVNSIYKWNNELINEQECLLLIKTTSRSIKSLKEFFKENHPYELPEFIELKVNASEGYSNWLLKMTKQSIN